VLAIGGGAIAAGIMGFVYHLVANKAGIDYIIALSAILGAVVGFIVGQASRIGGLRALLVVTVIAFVFGVAGYVARYFFEFNDQIDTAVQEVIQDATAAGFTADEVRQLMLEEVATAYPPGGVVGYLQFVAESGFSVGSRGSETSEPMLQGGLAWGLLAVEALAAGLVAAGTARGILRKAEVVAMTPSSLPPSAPTGM
jgi:hypothetical protein